MKIFSMVVLLSSNFALAYLLPKQEFGAFLYISGFIAIVGAISSFGITSLPVRFASAYWDHGDASSSRGLILFTFLGCSLSSFVAALIVWAWALLASIEPQVSLIGIGLTVYWCIVVINFQGLLLAFGRSLEWHGISQFVELIAKPLAILAAILLVWTESITPSAQRVLTIQFGAIAAASFIQGFLLYWHSRSHLRTTRGFTFHKEWLSYCGAGYMQTLVSSWALNIEVFVVGLAATPNDTAIFGLAYRVTSGIGFFRNIGGIVAAPRYMRISRTKKDAADTYVWTSVKQVLVPTLVAAFAVATAAVNLQGFFPPGYEGLTYALCVLALFQVIRASMGNLDSIISIVLQPWAFGVTSLFYYPAYGCGIFLAYRLFGLSGALWMTVLGASMLSAICIWLYLHNQRK
ncbi:lipopolysaccharide biosynthesis protein [Bradyrhizobium liaoningense]|uniref:lipopolysaccharide biosynthesis protein n=1 Tax=Bradyrhizobium liaoningense TaxID=43992 RepID=UPI001BA7D510|nr:oligosaccharide flippase family protein [Bradyrhizobium liaoningense]MBR0987620.1 oligosaccharide flippase family protein [Bradyrhizobium liaoningense]